jgi:hypothetical protein
MQVELKWNYSPPFVQRLVRTLDNSVLVNLKRIIFQLDLRIPYFIEL